MFSQDKGFTLIEILAVIFVVTVGVVGTLGLIQTTTSSSRFVSYQLTATYLTQEGVELVRAVRDGNWLEQRSGASNDWDEGLNIGEWELSHTDFSQEDPNFRSWNETLLKIDGDGFNYDTGETTRFKRKISIINKEDLNGDGTDDKIKVGVEVTFNFRGDQYKVSAQENLFKWRRSP